MEKSITRAFVAGRITKNTHLFNEVEQEGLVLLTGNIYVKKAALKELGWKEGESLEVTIKRLEGQR